MKADVNLLSLKGGKKIIQVFLGLVWVFCKVFYQAICTCLAPSVKFPGAPKSFRIKMRSSRV